MAAPTVVSFATDPITSTADTTSVVTAPSGSGGLLIAFARCASARTISPPDGGWTELETATSGTSRGYLWWKADDAAGSYTFTASGTSSEMHAAVVRLDSGDTTSLVSADMTNSESPSDGDRSTVEAPGLTTTQNDALVLWFFGCAANAETATAPATTAEVFDAAGVASACGMVYCCSKTVASAGPEAAKSILKSAFSRWIATAVAINPSAGGGATRAPGGLIRLGIG